MSNTLLESLWARIDANIGSRITQIVELLTQSKAANQEAANHKDAAAASAAQVATMRDEVGSYVEELEPDRLQTLIGDKISDVVDGAPGDLDTLREIAEYAQDNRDITDQLNAAIGNKANKSHTHTTAEITDTTTWVNHADHPNKIPRTRNDGYLHGSDPIEGPHVAIKSYVDTEVAKKANTSHTHTQSQVTGLSTALNGKADTSHKHVSADITDSSPTGDSSGGKLVRWNAAGKIETSSDPSSDNDLTRKSYVDAALDEKADKSYVDARPAIFTVPDINSVPMDNLVPGDVVVDTTTWIFYYLK